MTDYRDDGSPLVEGDPGARSQLAFRPARRMEGALAWSGADEDYESCLDILGEAASGAANLESLIQKIRPCVRAMGVTADIVSAAELAEDVDQGGTRVSLWRTVCLEDGSRCTLWIEECEDGYQVAYMHPSDLQADGALQAVDGEDGDEAVDEEEAQGGQEEEGYDEYLGDGEDDEEEHDALAGDGRSPKERRRERERKRAETLARQLLDRIYRDLVNNDKLNDEAAVIERIRALFQQTKYTGIPVEPWPTPPDTGSIGPKPIGDIGYRDSYEVWIEIIEPEGEPIQLKIRFRRMLDAETANAVPDTGKGRTKMRRRYRYG